MATLIIERFAPPAGAREARLRAYSRARVTDELSGRTIWCAAARTAALERVIGVTVPVRVYLEALVGRDDIVVLDDLERAPAVRERGAHAVMNVPRAPRAPAAAVDAYLIGWTGSGTLAWRVAAVMPHADRVTEKDAGSGTDEEAWGSLLADVVDGDRDEHVGGLRRARPAVAVR